MAARAGALLDDNITRVIVETLTAIGVEVLDQRPFFGDWLEPAGCCSRRAPTDAEWDDVRRGLAVTRLMAGAQIGQTVVVRRGVVSAVEAIEGTTETIRRGTALGGPGAVVVKGVAPTHDFRFDTPGIGPDTLDVADRRRRDGGGRRGGSRGDHRSRGGGGARRRRRHRAGERGCRRSDAAPIMIVAGEASGDLHGATLCRALRTLAPGRRLVGMGGERMAAAGIERGGRRDRGCRRRRDRGARPAAHALPRVAPADGRATRRGAAPLSLVVIDFPEFNLRLARVARRAGVPVVYFIPPQVWAWRPGRIRAIHRRVTRVLAVLPFEVALYEAAGVPVTFVGHPVLDARRRRALAR